jgi:hypothetical protein
MAENPSKKVVARAETPQKKMVAAAYIRKKSLEIPKKNYR